MQENASSAEPPDGARGEGAAKRRTDGAASSAPRRTAKPAEGGKTPQPGAQVPKIIWTLPPAQGRGPQPAHSRASITEAAVRLADEEGFEALSMRRVAAAVGAGTMSLYRYVPGKDELLDLMLDHIGGEYVLPEAPSGDWRADLLDLARQERRLLHRHPWAVRVPGGVSSMGPNSLRFFDFCLAVLEATALDPAAKMETIAMLIGGVRSYVEFELAQVLQEQRTGVTAAQRQAAEMAYLGSVIASGRYPHLTRVGMESAGGGPPQRPDPDQQFERMVLRLLDGVGG